MTPAQIQAFMEWVEAAIAVAIEDHAGRDSGQESYKAGAAREAVYASFGVNEDGTPLEVPDPAPVPGPWKVACWSSNDQGVRYGIQHKDTGEWLRYFGATEPWTGTKDAAQRRADSRNDVDLGE